MRTGPEGQRLGPVEWVDLDVSPAEMRPFFSLVTGQCFHWSQLADDLWVGVVGPYALAIKESTTTTYFASLGTLPDNDVTDIEEETHSYLRSYFQLDENFTDLFALVSTENVFAYAPVSMYAPTVFINRCIYN